MTDEAVLASFSTQMIALGGKFVLDARCARFRAPVLGLALAWWREAAGPAGIPRREAMTPAVMRPFIKKIALFERVERHGGGHRYRARLTGQEFAAAYTEMSGKFVDEVVPEKYLPRWNLVADMALACQAPIRLLLLPEAFNRDHSVLECLIAPLLDETERPTQFFVVANFERGQSWAAVEAEEARASRG